jgi:hypothetical protein
MVACCVHGFWFLQCAATASAAIVLCQAPRYACFQQLQQAVGAFLARDSNAACALRTKC